MFLTCDLGLDLTLHLQRVHEDAAVTDETGAGYTSVWLAESLFIKILPETYGKKQRREFVYRYLNNFITYSMSEVFITRRARRYCS